MRSPTANQLRLLGSLSVVALYIGLVWSLAVSPALQLLFLFFGAMEFYGQVVWKPKVPLPIFWAVFVLLEFSAVKDPISGFSPGLFGPVGCFAVLQIAVNPRTPGWMQPWLFPILWLPTALLIEFQWARPFHSQTAEALSAYPILFQPAALFGIWGALFFATLLVSSLALLALDRLNRGSRPLWVYGLPLLVVSIAYGSSALHLATLRTSTNPPLRVAVVASRSKSTEPAKLRAEVQRALSQKPDLLYLLSPYKIEDTLGMTLKDLAQQQQTTILSNELFTPSQVFDHAHPARVLKQTEPYFSPLAVSLPHPGPYAELFPLSYVHHQDFTSAMQYRPPQLLLFGREESDKKWWIQPLPYRLAALRWHRPVIVDNFPIFFEIIDAQGRPQRTLYYADFVNLAPITYFLTLPTP